MRERERERKERKKKGKQTATSCSSSICWHHHHIFFLIFLDCAIIIDKGKCILICWIDITLRACIAWTKVATRIIRRQRLFCDCFLLAPVGCFFFLRSQEVRFFGQFLPNKLMGGFFFGGGGGRWIFFFCTFTYCHGRLFRCGDTSTQLPLSGLYRLCDISSSISLDMTMICRPFFESA